MKLIAILLTLLALMPCCGADEVYPLREARDGEGRESWWWEVFNKPVVVVRGSLEETRKDRPDLSIAGTYDAWSKLTAPSLANQPTEKGFYLLLTHLEVKEVLYVDPTLLHSDANINWLIDRKKNRFDCILPANLVQIGEPDSQGHYTFAYQLYLPGEEDVPAHKEFILVFQYVTLYPLQGLHLTAVADCSKLDQIRKIGEYRRSRQPAQ